MQDPNQSGTNEGKFMEGLRAFMKEVPHLVAAERQKDLEKLVFYYENPGATKHDPLLSLPPSEARVMVQAQERVAAHLSEHPFFRRVSEIARQRWSQEVQEIIDARNYYIQCDIGATPENRPGEEVLALVRAASKDAPIYEGLAKKDFPNDRTNSIRTPASPSRFDVILQFVKDNW